MRTSIIFAVVCSLGGLVMEAGAEEPRPPGIGVRVTMAGPVFVDARGMTLYSRASSRGRNDFPCPDTPQTVVPFETLIYDPVEEFPMRVPDADARRSCTEKYPPLVAPAGAGPLGNWTVHERPNGIRQWAYRGNPLHLATKDRLPGDIHGDDTAVASRRTQNWEAAAAPLEAPPGVQTRLTALGLVLTDYQGKTLYQPASRGPSESKHWKPLRVPMAAVADKLPADWSTMDDRNGLTLWAWKGKPVYTYARDSGDRRPRDRAGRHVFVDVFGETYGKPIPGWQPVVIKAASAPPEGVQVVPTVADGSTVPSPRIYADASGKTLYVISCNEMTPDGLDCDDVGDSPRYWLSFCGGEKTCRENWRTLPAPRNARPIDGLWSVAIINPSHPYKPLAEGENGIAVWKFRGRLVFTYGPDEKPGDTWGSRAMSHAKPDSSAIPAFAPG